MEFNSVITILQGMSNTLELIKNNTRLKHLQGSRFYSTNNELVFADIQLAVNEVLEGLLQAQQKEQEYLQLLDPGTLLEGQIQKSRLNQSLLNGKEN